MAATRTDEPDDILLRHIASGDEEAMVAFYDRHFSLVAGYCRTLIQDRGIAEEAIQDAFLQVWRLAGRFDGSRAKVTTWLFVLARSRCLDRLRQAGRQTSLESLHAGEEPLGGIAEEAHDQDSDPTGTAVLARFEREQVRSLLSAIPEEQRSALEAAYLLGWTADRIARAQDVPLGTAKARIRLGLLRLRRLLEEVGSP